MKTNTTPRKYPRRMNKYERAEFDRKEALPFVSKYYRLRYVASGAFGNPRFPWVTTFKGNPKLDKTGHVCRAAAQAHATHQDEFIDGVIAALSFSMVGRQIQRTGFGPDNDRIGGTVKSLYVAMDSSGEFPENINADTFFSGLLRVIIQPPTESQT